jgi:hypothetical protein
MVMSPDSEFFNYLKSPQGRRALETVQEALPAPEESPAADESAAILPAPEPEPQPEPATEAAQALPNATE